MKKSVVLAFASILVLGLAFASPAFAHTATVSVSPKSVRSGDTITVSGSVSPTPAPSGTSANVAIFNPQGVQVDFKAAPVTAATGAFSVTFTVGGPAERWTSGAYRATVTYAHDLVETPTSASDTFTFTAVGVPAAVGVQLQITVEATTPLVPGQAGRISALLMWSNGSLARVSNYPIQHFWTPGNTVVNLAAFQTFHVGLYWWDFPAQTAPGSYTLHIQANVSGVQAASIAVITVTDSLASSSDVSAAKSAADAAKAAADSATNAANAAKNSADAAKAASESVSAAVGQISTFVLIVAVLAVITLILEIAVLMRRRPQ